MHMHFSVQYKHYEAAGVSRQIDIIELLSAVSRIESLSPIPYLHPSRDMANSRYEYVKAFEQTTILLPNTYIVVRIDGRGFHKFSNEYNFMKPNDRRALDLMNAAAVAVMRDLPDISFAYGISDEFSFLFDRSCKLFDRRERPY
ncbi:hypothetical protein N7G274_007946 [Stereocaulon virgatum]|uniref:tRNA(His) guanylyltransferase n=1 Tax=Stereocaulon virgatum TaxID=373712 RepID=A0ABR4A7H8_9LECA